MTVVLHVDAIRKSFGGIDAVKNVSFTLQAGEVLAMIGPNGAGKSTCFNMLNGQIRPDAGRVRLLDHSIIGLSPRHIARLGVGRTFQITATFSSMTVGENVQLTLAVTQRTSFASLRPLAWQFQQKAEAILVRVGLGSQRNRACGELAYGDLKRLELAMALANSPRLLLMDEPTAGMAPTERIELMQLTASIAREQNLAVLFTEHDMDVVFEHADRVIVLDRGSIIAQGPPSQVRNDERVRAVYLGGGSTFGAQVNQAVTP